MPNQQVTEQQAVKPYTGDRYQKYNWTDVKSFEKDLVQNLRKCEIKPLLAF